MARAASLLVALVVPLLYFMGSQEIPEATNYGTTVGERKDATLAEVVRALEAYLEKPIVLTSRKVAALKVGGSFNVDNVDAMSRWQSPFLHNHR